MIRRDIWVWLLALTLTVAGFGGAVTSLRGVSAAPTANLTPTVTAPVAVLVTNWALEPSRIGVRLTWSASDSDGSIAQVQLQHSTDGSAWVDEPLISATAMSDAQALTSGVAHVFQVRVQDNAGAWSAWKRGGKFTVTPHQQPRSNPQSSDQVTYYDGTWNTSTHTDFYGDQVCYASALGPRAKFEFQGEGVAWLSTRGFNRGKADVYLDNILVDDDVDLYNDGYLFRRIVFARNGLDASRPHTLEVRPTGAKNAASANTHVDVDEFVVLGAPKLRWAPPTLSSLTTIDLGAACTDTADYNCDLVKGDNNQGKRNYWLTDGRDYTLTLPTDRRVYGEFNISGGRNVVLIGGHLSL